MTRRSAWVAMVVALVVVSAFVIFVVWRDPSPSDEVQVGEAASSTDEVEAPPFTMATARNQSPSTTLPDVDPTASSTTTTTTAPFRPDDAVCVAFNDFRDIVLSASEGEAPDDPTDVPGRLRQVAERFREIDPVRFAATAQLLVEAADAAEGATDVDQLRTALGPVIAPQDDAALGALAPVREHVVANCPSLL